MEKNGAIVPGVTPPENSDTAAACPDVKLAEDAQLRVIRELDGDFRKCAAEATKKQLR